jgi:UDP-glucose 4-epimerase
MPSISGGKFVVVGAASQVGSHICEMLLQAEAREVVLLDNLSLGTADILAPLLNDKRCRFVKGDVMRLNELFDPFQGADGVFLVAGLMASTIKEAPWVGVDVNVRGVQNTLEACRIQGIKKVIYSSSAGVYGALKDDPTTENTPLHWEELSPPMVLYCASKIMGEGLAKLYEQQHGIAYIALRYTAVYGERQHRRALVGGHIAETCERIRSGLRPVVEGNGEQARDYVYAGDVARANLLAMESQVTGEGINICSGIDTTQLSVVELALKACGSDLRPEFASSENTSKLPSTAKQGYSREKAKLLLGWTPQVSIEEGIGKVLHWVDQVRSCQA